MVTKCGVCVSIFFSCLGMWAHCMTAADYQDLIDRGKFEPFEVYISLLLLSEMIRNTI